MQTILQKKKQRMKWLHLKFALAERDDDKHLANKYYSEAVILNREIAQLLNEREEK